MWHTGGQNQRVRALHRVTPWCQPWGFMEPATHQQEGSRGGGTPGVPKGCMQEDRPIQTTRVSQCGPCSGFLNHWNKVTDLREFASLTTRSKNIIKAENTRKFHLKAFRWARVSIDLEEVRSVLCTRGRGSHPWV